MRCWRAPKSGRPSGPNATTSPSRIARWWLSARFSRDSSGYRAVISLRLRLKRRNRPGSEWQIARTPSHLTSWAQRSSSRGRGPSRASMGATFAGMGSAVGSAGGSMRWIIQFFGSASLSIGKSA